MSRRPSQATARSPAPAHPHPTSPPRTALQPGAHRQAPPAHPPNRPQAHPAIHAHPREDPRTRAATPSPEWDEPHPALALDQARSAVRNRIPARPAPAPAEAHPSRPEDLHAATPTPEAHPRAISPAAVRSRRPGKVAANRRCGRPQVAAVLPEAGPQAAQGRTVVVRACGAILGRRPAAGGVAATRRPLPDRVVGAGPRSMPRPSLRSARFISAPIPHNGQRYNVPRTITATQTKNGTSPVTGGRAVFRVSLQVLPRVGHRVY